VVREETDALYAEDTRRLRSLLALRSADSREFFRRNAGSWEALRTDLYGGGFVLPTLLQLLPTGLVVADLGCGTGETVATLAPVVDEVIGIDREQAMLDAAALRTQGFANVRLELGGLDALPLSDNSIDAALCSLVLQHVSDLRVAMCEVARTLRPGGVLLVLDLQPHARSDLLRTLGHRHAGFSAADLSHLGAHAGLVLETWRPLPETPGALGPPLFLARLVRPSG
jgi:ArsR family transcriptional regulator